ncbi:MAG: hypothetical protein ACE5E3_05640 [Mariprofundus sp.]
MLKSIFLIAILVFVMQNPAVHAAGGLSVDAKYDLTGDGIVDASDWAKMSEDAKKTYADESIKALGEDPHALLEGQQTRGARYLQGLRSVYE